MRIISAIRGALPTLPALLALLPAFSCPLCVSAYLGAAASLGLGVLLTVKVLNPLIVGLLAASVASSVWSGYRLRRWRPTLLMSLGAAAILVARFAAPVPGLTTVGAVVLIATSIYSLIIRRWHR